MDIKKIGDRGPGVPGQEPARGETAVGREVRSVASSARKVPARLSYGRRALWLTRGGRVRGTGAWGRPGGSAGPRDHLRQPTASWAFPSAATGSLQALKPRLVLTATSLPISSFAFWTENVPHLCSREAFQVLPGRCAARCWTPEYYRGRVISVGHLD